MNRARDRLDNAAHADIVRFTMTRLITLVLFSVLASCGTTPEATKAPGQTPPGESTGAGTLSGTVTFVGTPCPEPKGPPCDGPYPAYDVVVYDDDGDIVGTATTAADGTFAAEFPPGSYVISTQAGPRPTDRNVTKVVVARDARVQVELRVDTGVR